MEALLLITEQKELAERRRQETERKKETIKQWTKVHSVDTTVPLADMVLPGLDTSTLVPLGASDRSTSLP